MIQARAFSEDEYQACSGIGHGAEKKTVVVDRKYSAGAEAHLYFEAFCSTTEVVPCYKATTLYHFYTIAGASMIFIFRKWCRPEFHWYPTLSAEKSGKDGARMSTARAKML
jgi:hypothetical protein